MAAEPTRFLHQTVAPTRGSSGLLPNPDQSFATFTPHFGLAGIAALSIDRSLGNEFRGLCVMYEYKVVPAPQVRPRGLPSGTKSENRQAEGFNPTEDACDSFDTVSDAVKAVIHRMAGELWEFQRGEVLEERGGFLRRGQKRFHPVLVFRREIVRMDTKADAPDVARFSADGPAPRAVRAKDKELLDIVRNGGRRIAQNGRRSGEPVSPIEAVGGKIHRSVMRSQSA